MKKLLAATSASAFVFASAVSAMAQQPPANCPPGAWFCGEGQQQPGPPPVPPPPPPPPTGVQYAPLPAPLPPPQAQAPQYAPAPQYPQQAPRYAPPQYAPPPPVQGQAPRQRTTIYVQQGQTPVVIYQQPYVAPAPPPPPAPVQQQYVIVRPQQPQYIYASPPPPPVMYAEPGWDRWREWGINAHLEGLDIGRGPNTGSGGSGMGGFGASLRYKPTPHLGVETGLDWVSGTDYNGNARNETAWTFNGLYFVNPQNRLQLYFLGGFGWSWAHVNDTNINPTTSQQADLGGSQNYTYFGGQGGAGLEFRITRSWALSSDLRGFVRSRIGVGDSAPEFTSPTGQTTNTSGGGVFTLGSTFYF